MTVSSTISRSGPYAGAGTTGPFAVGFRFLEDAHLRVVKTNSQGVDADLILGIDFFASGAGEANGSVILVAPLATNERLTILRNVPATQDADYVQNDAFPAESHERALDKLTMIAQQQAEQLGRTLRLGVLVNTNPEFPSPSPNKLIGWDSAGTRLVNADIAALSEQFVYADWRYETFTGDGTQVQFLLAGAPSNIANAAVSINGLVKVPVAEFALDGNVLTFAMPSVMGATVLVRYGKTVGQIGGTQTAYRQVAAAGQTVFTLVDGYTPGASALAVYVNGLRMEGSGVDFTERDSTSVVFAEPLQAGDSVVFVVGSEVAGGGGGGGGVTPAEGLVIALIGDSLTTQNALLDEAPSHILERTLRHMGAPCTVIPCGRDGNTFYRANTQKIYGNLTSVEKAIASQASVVLVALGLNDSVNAVDGRSAAQIRADAAATFAALRLGLPSAKIFYVGEVPHAIDLTSGEQAALKNKHVIPSTMALRTSGLLAGRWSEEILGDSIGATMQARYDSWRALHSYVKALTTHNGSFDMWVQQIHRAGGGTSDRLHFNHAGSTLAAGYLLKGLRDAAVFPALMTNSYPVWEDPFFFIPAIISGTQPAPAARDALGGDLHPWSWWCGWDLKFRMVPEVINDANGVFVWTLEGGPPSSNVLFSANGSAWSAPIGSTGPSGDLLSAAGGTLMGVLGLGPGTHQLRYAVGDVVLGPYSLLVVAGSGGGGTYTLPAATDTVRGGIKVGANLAISSDVLSVPLATKLAAGAVKVGTRLSVTDGVVDVPLATASVVGAVKVGAGLSVSGDGTLSATGGAIVWNDLPLAAGWSAYTGFGDNTPRYAIFNGVLYLRGVASNAGVAIGDAFVHFATLPFGARPATTGLPIISIVLGGSRAGLMVIESDGRLQAMRAAGAGAGASHVFITGTVIPM